TIASSSRPSRALTSLLPSVFGIVLPQESPSRLELNRSHFQSLHVYSGHLRRLVSTMLSSPFARLAESAHRRRDTESRLPGLQALSFSDESSGWPDLVVSPKITSHRPCL